MKGKRENKQPVPVLKNAPSADWGEHQGRWVSFGALSLILLISLIVYLPVFNNELLAWDDNAYIKDDPLVYTFNLKEIFSQFVMGNYHPVTILVLAIEHSFFGLNPDGYHAVNLFLHLLNVMLVFYVIYNLSNKLIVALVASLLFGVHPLHVESVAWAAELKDLLYTFFFLCSYNLYLKYIKNQDRKLLLYALLVFLLSLLSKAMAASLPLVLILTDYFKGRQINKGTLLEKAPFFLLSLVFGIVAIIAQRSSGATDLVTNYNLFERIVIASFGFVSYLFKLVRPLNLSSFYPYPLSAGGNLPVEYYGYLFLFLCMAAYTVYSFRFTKKIIFGIGFFTLTVLLVLQILPVGKVIMADRYSYIPSIGIFYVAGEGILWLWNKNYKLPAVALLSISAILFSVKTYSRCGIWKDDLTLWNDVISQDKSVVEAYFNRGIIFLEEKKNDEALMDFNRAIELAPRYANSYNGRGIIFTNEKRNAEAVGEFNKSIELNPGYADAYNNRGIVYKSEGRNAEAINDFSKAIELKSNYVDAFYNRGSAFLAERRTDEAINDLNRAISLDPSNAEAYNTRGSAYVSERRIAEAKDDFNRAIALNPGFSEAYYNRGSIFVNEKRNAEAISDFSKAIELNPGYANAYNNRGIVFVNEKRNADAIADFNKAIGLKPDLANAYNNRGIVFMNENRSAEAINDFIKAIELQPGYISAYNSLGNLFFDEKRYAKAIGCYVRVIELKSDYAQAYYKKGLAEYYSGNRGNACGDLKKAVSLGSKQAEGALSQLCK